MSAKRWDNLDLDRLQPAADVPGHHLRSAPAALQDQAVTALQAPGTPGNEPLPRDVAQALGAYLLRNYQATVELLEPRLSDCPHLPGGQRVLACALVRLNRESEAADRLREAVRQSPSDWLARAALASAMLRAREEDVNASPVTEALEHLEVALGFAPETRESALRELLGAAYWRSGQEALRSGQDRPAAAQFAAAARQFGAAAKRSAAARHALPARQAATFVGQAVALLLSGQVEAAQQLFSRSPVPGVRGTDPVGRFAALLYELCDELVRVPAGEVAAAAGELRLVVLQTRLEISFYDGRQAVTLAWLGGIS